MCLFTTNCVITRNKESVYRLLKGAALPLTARVALWTFKCTNKDSNLQSPKGKVQRYFPSILPPILEIKIYLFLTSDLFFSRQFHRNKMSFPTKDSGVIRHSQGKHNKTKNPANLNPSLTRYT